MRRKALTAVLLVVAIVAAYWWLRQAGFLNFDDPVYVTNNPEVLHGLSWHGLVWAFDGTHAGFWHPLTWLSHMLDWQLFGKNAGGHHLSSLLLHCVNSLLLLGVLRRMTGAFWRSAMVAGLFGLHPLHVESVAWISERKDLLSTFFFLLTLAGYMRFVEWRSSGNSRARMWYGLTLLAYVASLMSKPMMVTLPFLLLLLDYWPLRRFALGKDVELSRARILALEKLPFLVLAVVASIVAVIAESKGGAIADTHQVPITSRLTNAVVSYATYLGKTFVPMDLIVTYPLKRSWPMVEIIVAVVVLIGGSALAIAWIQKRPYVFVGWFWFVGTLIPVIGLVQVGAHSMADRYTYVPLIGFFVAVVWSAADWLAAQPQGREVAALAGVVILVACGFATRRQAAYWHDSETLFSRAVRVNPENFLAYHHLGLSYLTAGKFPEAISNLDQSIRFGPEYPPAWFARGIAYGLTGNLEAAERDFRENIRLKPESYHAYFHLGKVYALQSRFDDAKTNFLQAIRLKPDYSEALVLLANVLQIQGATAEAIPYLETAVKAQPEYGEGRYYLATALTTQGRFAEAVANLEAAIKYQPDFAPAFNDLALLVVTRNEPAIRDVAKGTQLAEQACKLTSNQNPLYLQTLAAAYAAVGRLRDAASAAQQGLDLAVAKGNGDLADQLRAQLAQYQAGQTNGVNSRPQ